MMWMDFGIRDLIDVLLVAIILYQTYKIMKSSGTLAIFGGVVSFIVVWILISQVFEMRLLGSIMDKFINVGVLVLVILFQDEIRRFLSALGSHQGWKFFAKIFSKRCEDSEQEGKYIAGAAPYGYERIKIKGAKGYTLVIIEDKAAVVRHIYDLYLNGLPQTNGSLKHVGSSVIAKQLDLEGIPSPSGGRWAAYTVRDILNNPTYAGYVRWSWRPTVRKVVDGVLTETRPVNKSMSLTEGIHPPIIDRASWQRAQDIMASRAYLPMPGNKTIVNPLAGLLYCSQCGRSLVRTKGRRGNAKDMLFCPNKDCTCKGSTLDAVEAALKLSLKQWLQDYKVSVKPNKRGPRKSSTAPLEKSLEALNRERDTLVGQKGRLYDLLEQGVYSIDVFTQRQFDLATRISQTEEAIQRVQEQLDNERYLNTMRLAIIPRVEHLLDVYDQLETPQEKNEMLKACLEKVIYTKTEGGRYTESNMQLQLYPRITHIPKGRTHIS